MKKVTNAQIIEAIALNGYEQGFNHMLESDDPDKKIVNACALGQAALNLGVTFDDLSAWDGITLFHVMSLNDTHKKNLKQIARAIKRELKDQLNKEFDFTEIDYAEKYENYQGVKI